jgi:hypothetical protein
MLRFPSLRSGQALSTTLLFRGFGIKNKILSIVISNPVNPVKKKPRIVPGAFIYSLM